MVALNISYWEGVVPQQRPCNELRYTRNSALP